MDVAGTFLANLMTILLALQDISVSFHFAKNLDLDELDYFEFISVVCRHRHFRRLWSTEAEPAPRGADGLLKLHILNSLKSKLINCFLSLSKLVLMKF